jgi:hypothetical protein
MARFILQYALIIAALPLIVAGLLLHVVYGFVASGWIMGEELMSRIYN